METIRLEVCIYGMCVSLVLVHGVCYLSFCMECVSCPSAWSVSLVLLHGVCLLSFCMECVSCPSAWSVSLVLLYDVFVLCTWGMLSLHMVVCT